MIELITVILCFRHQHRRIRRVEVGDAQFDQTHLGGSPSELAEKPSLCSDRQVAKTLSPDKLAPVGDSVESITRKDEVMTLPRILALESLGFEWKPSIGPGNGTLKKPGLDDNARRAHKKPANSRQGAASQLETVQPLNWKRHHSTKSLGPWAIISP
jgi:hypothetical protein